MPRRPRDRDAESKAAEDALELAQRKDRAQPNGLMNTDEMKYLPVSDDEVLSLGEKLRAREPQPVTKYRVCETCGGRGGLVRHVEDPRGLTNRFATDRCLNCGGEGRVAVETRDMTQAERVAFDRASEC